MKTVVACFKLHNKCIKDRLPMPEVDFDIQHPGEEEINNLQATNAFEIVSSIYLQVKTTRDIKVIKINVIMSS